MGTPWPWWDEWQERSVPIRRKRPERRPMQPDPRDGPILARTAPRPPAAIDDAREAWPRAGDGAVRIKHRPAMPYEPTPLGEPPSPHGEPPSPARAPVPESSSTAAASVDDALAELSAVRERLERDAQRVLEETKSRLVEQLIPVLDNLDRSIDAARDSTDSGLREGIRVVRDQFEQVLAGYGVEPIEAEGARFDPSEHDALAVVEVQTADGDGMVVDVVQRGYRRNGRLLRPARVRVGKARHGIENAPTSQDVAPDPI